MKILNLTQHPATPEQRAQGVVDLPDAVRVRLKRLLTFEQIPLAQEVWDRAIAIADLALATDADAAMLGGAPFLMEPLATELRAHGFQVLYAFSRRESVEQVQRDGSVTKVAKFRHIGFVEV